MQNSSYEKSRDLQNKIKILAQKVTDIANLIATADF